MEKCLRDLGYEFEKLSKEDDKVQRWKFEMEIDGRNYKVQLLSDGTDLQLYSGFEGKVRLAKLNEWNRSKRWGRAYLQKEGDSVAMETDLDFTGGVSLNEVKETVKLYKVLLTAFVKFLKDAGDE